MERPSAQVVFTNKSSCRDCYRCLRKCPVKAIRLEKGQAFVVPDLCILCGTCISECPQKAKAFRNDLGVVKALLGTRRVAVSVAPSFAAHYAPWEIRRIPSALRRLGFFRVEETARGAAHVGEAVARMMERAKTAPVIGSACPVVVSYVEKYRPELVEFLTPIHSPMAAHAKMLKEEFPGAAVVFLGPCVAKKGDADLQPHVDTALTFTEFDGWLAEEGIDLATLEESDFDVQFPSEARTFPLEGGVSRSARLDSDSISPTVINASGHEEIREVLDFIAQSPRPVFVEALFCAQGCINGPAMDHGRSLFARKMDCIAYAALKDQDVPLGPQITITTAYEGHPVHRTPISADRIDALLEEMGKGRREDQLDCGACGYGSCREKAEAVIRGMAEKEMCLPLMRRLAEQRTDRIIETIPSGVVILDKDFSIIHMNPAFRKFFICSEAIYGRHISYLMDPHPFERLARDGGLINETVDHKHYNLTLRQLMYQLPLEEQYVGIFVDITNHEKDRRQLADMREKTVEQAQELLEHQISFAREMARFLGESTAKGELLVENLLRVVRENEGGRQ